MTGNGKGRKILPQIVGAIMMIAIIVISGCVGNSDQDTKIATQDSTLQSSGKSGNSAVANVTNTPTGTSTKIYDIHNREVSSSNIIVIGKVSNTLDQFSQPPHLTGNGQIDIQVRFVPSTQTINVIVNNIPDSSKKTTYLRVRLYDKNGLVSYNTDQGVRDYLQDIRLIKGSANRAGEASLAIYDDQLIRPIEKVTEMHLTVYFI